jgi:hypothetical protein
MATTWIKPIRAGKSIASTLNQRTEYVKNYDKTESGEYIVAFECDERTVDAEFLLSKKLYEQQTGRIQGRNNIVAYHIRQSFKPGEVTTEQALEIGYDLAMRWTKGKHQFIVTAHTDTNSPHTHIIFNSTSSDHKKKFRNVKWSSIALRRLSDQICLENGLSVIDKPKPSKGWNRVEYLGVNKPPTVREQLRDLIDTAINGCKSYDEFLAALEALGVEIKHNKQSSFKLPGGKKFSRQGTLGDDYTFEAILERISGKRIIVSKPKNAPSMSEHKPNLLIDIQAKIQEGKGAGYEHWARIFNLKESARTLLFLKEVGIDSYDELIRKSAAVSAEFNERLTRIKEIEARLKEISGLQKHIGTYGKTRDIYGQYQAIKSLKRREDFYENNRADIALHEAAKKHFDELGYSKNNKKLPTIASLKQEYAILATEKKKLYVGYRELKENRNALLTAKSNAQRILGVDLHAQNLDSSHSQKRNNSRDR